MMNKKLILRRKELGLSQANLASAVGVSRASVGKWESGESSIKGDNLLPLAKALKCDLDWLLTDQGTSAPTSISGTGISSNSLTSHQSNTTIVELDFYDVEVSAGHGALVIQEDQGDCITFSRQFIDRVIGVNTSDVFLMPVRGDSMTPTLNNQAIIMVKKIIDFTGDGIYVFRFDGQLMVKRLQFSKTGLTVVSDNTNYDKWELTRNELATEDFEIIGQVVWSGQRM